MTTYNSPHATNRPPTIAVFDSGFGGLTVLRALLHLIPAADYIYLGDTARLPYGAKSRQTIARYAVESARFLAAGGADLLVIACNTATALALPEIASAVAIPVVGVIEPVVQAAATSVPPTSLPLVPYPSTPSSVLVLATEATVQSHAYRQACQRHNLRATEKACPLLVPLVEESWIDHPVTREVLRIYLAEALAASNPTAVLLGCTHYPLLQPLIRQTLDTLGSHAVIIDSAQATAQAVRNLLQEAHSEVHLSGAPSQTVPSSEVGTCTFYTTDSIEKFQRLGAAFLGKPLPQVHLLDLGG